MIGLKISRHFFIQSEIKPKPIPIRSQTFSRAFRRLPVFTSCFDWLSGFPLSFVISKTGDFGFVSTELLTAIFESIFSLWEFLGSNTSENIM